MLIPIWAKHNIQELHYRIIYEGEPHRICNGEIELTKSPESGNYILRLHTGYSEAGAVHTAEYRIGAMYEVKLVQI